jgi:hypothetical protein
MQMTSCMVQRCCLCSHAKSTVGSKMSARLNSGALSLWERSLQLAPVLTGKRSSPLAPGGNRSAQTTTRCENDAAVCTPVFPIKG